MASGLRAHAAGPRTKAGAVRSRPAAGRGGPRVRQMTTPIRGATTRRPRRTSGGGAAMPDDTKTMGRPDAPELTKAWETTCTALLDGHQLALTQWLQTIQRTSDEMAQLAETRFQLAMEAWSALAACRGPEDL